MSEVAADAGGDAGRACGLRWTRSRRFGVGSGWWFRCSSFMTSRVRAGVTLHHSELSLRGLNDPDMFERYTPSARQVVAFANEEARSLRHGALGVEHLLLGILLDGVGHGGARAARARASAPSSSASRVAELLPPGTRDRRRRSRSRRARSSCSRAPTASRAGWATSGVGTEHLAAGARTRARAASRRASSREQGIGAEAAARRCAPLARGGRRAAGRRRRPQRRPTLRRAQPFAAVPDHLGVPLADDARRVLGRALAAALADGRDELTAADLRAALSLGLTREERGSPLVD